MGTVAVYEITDEQKLEKVLNGPRWHERHFLYTKRFKADEPIEFTVLTEREAVKKVLAALKDSDKRILCHITTLGVNWWIYDKEASNHRNNDGDRGSKADS